MLLQMVSYVDERAGLFQLSMLGPERNVMKVELPCHVDDGL